jgi:hypothetical protein
MLMSIFQCETTCSHRVRSMFLKMVGLDPVRFCRSCRASCAFTKSNLNLNLQCHDVMEAIKVIVIRSYGVEPLSRLKGGFITQRY